MRWVPLMKSQRWASQSDRPGWRLESVWGRGGVRTASGVLPELQEAAVSLSPAVKLYSKTARRDNSSFSTSCQSGLHAVCSMQKTDRQYPEETNTSGQSSDMWKVSLPLIHQHFHGPPVAHVCLLCSSTPWLHSPNTLDCLRVVFLYIFDLYFHIFALLLAIAL